MRIFDLFILSASVAIYKSYQSHFDSDTPRQIYKQEAGPSTTSASFVPIKPIDQFRPTEFTKTHHLTSASFLMLHKMLVFSAIDSTHHTLCSRKPSLDRPLSCLHPRQQANNGPSPATYRLRLHHDLHRHNGRPRFVASRSGSSRNLLLPLSTQARSKSPKNSKNKLIGRCDASLSSQ